MLLLLCGSQSAVLICICSYSDKLSVCAHPPHPLHLPRTLTSCSVWCANTSKSNLQLMLYNAVEPESDVWSSSRMKITLSAVRKWVWQKGKSRCPCWCSRTVVWDFIKGEVTRKRGRKWDSNSIAQVEERLCDRTDDCICMLFFLSILMLSRTFCLVSLLTLRNKRGMSRCL